MRWLRPWVIFAGCVLVVVLLDWAEPVLLPVAGALLLTFLLNPWVNGLQRWIRRGPAVVLVAGHYRRRDAARLGPRTETSLARSRQPSREHPAEDRRRSNMSCGGASSVQSTLEEIKEDIKKDTAARKPGLQADACHHRQRDGHRSDRHPVAGPLPALGAAGHRARDLHVTRTADARPIVALAGDSHPPPPPKRSTMRRAQPLLDDPPSTPFTASASAPARGSSACPSVALGGGRRSLPLHPPYVGLVDAAVARSP